MLLESLVVCIANIEIISLILLIYLVTFRKINTYDF